MTDKHLTVSDGLIVSLDYALRLDDGEVIDTSAGREPLDYLHGSGQIIPGLEQELHGLAVGDEKDVEVAPADGYGLRDADAFQEIPMAAFPPDAELEPGMAFELLSNSGDPITAFVAEVRPESVLLDFNHPLAGETLHFRIKIAALRAATAEELAHGHAHGAGHEH